MLCKITGHKFFEGNIDGKGIDSGRVFVEMKLNEANGREKGTCSVEFRVPNSACIERIKHIPLPAMFNLETEQIADGKNGFKTVVLDVIPVDVVASTGEIVPRPSIKPVSQAKQA